MTWESMCYEKPKGERHKEPTFFFSLPQVNNNRRFNLEKVSVFFRYNSEDFVILLGMQELGMPKEFKNSWDECSKLKCAHLQNQLTN